MIPAIGQFSSVEMIRDGRSLAATFHGTDACEYWLFFKVLITVHPGGAWERTRYDAPVIRDILAGTEIPITWQHARIFLHQIRPLLETERDQKWYEAMEETAAAEGALPKCVSAHFDERPLFTTTPS